MKRCLAVVIFVMTALVSAASGRACDLQLVLAVDVSGSVNRQEYRLQMGGLAQALRSEAVSRLLVQAGSKGAYLTLMQWSGEPHQLQVVPWRQITDAASVAAFADAVEKAPRAYKIYSTAIGQALRSARRLFDQHGLVCKRRVIDVSGDGRSNEGLPADLVRDQLVHAGIAINGLVITGEDKGLKSYFQRNVIGGNGAFVLAVERFEDYPQAIRRKLLKEIAPRIIWDIPARRIAADSATPKGAARP